MDIAVKTGARPMTHEEQVAIAIEHFSALKRIKEIKSRGTPRSERDAITMECLGYVDLVRDVVRIEHLITFDADTFALADVLLRSIARHHPPKI
jgi:hypothetical protein